MLERRLDHQAAFGRLDFDVQAARSEPLSLSLRVLEFAAVFVQVQDASRIKIVADARIAPQLAQLLVAIQRKRESGIGVAAGPARQTFKEEAQTPKPLGEVGARPEEQRGVLAPEPLKDRQGSGRVGPGFGVADRNLPAICKTRLKRRLGLTVHHHDLVAALREIPRARRAYDTGAENDHSHAR